MPSRPRHEAPARRPRRPGPRGIRRKNTGTLANTQGTFIGTAGILRRRPPLPAILGKSGPIRQGNARCATTQAAVHRNFPHSRRGFFRNAAGGLRLDCSHVSAKQTGSIRMANRQAVLRRHPVGDRCGLPLRACLRPIGGACQGCRPQLRRRYGQVDSSARQRSRSPNPGVRRLAIETRAGPVYDRFNQHQAYGERIGAPT